MGSLMGPLPTPSEALTHHRRAAEFPAWSWPESEREGRRQTEQVWATALLRLRESVEVQTRGAHDTMRT